MSEPFPDPAARIRRQAQPLTQPAAAASQLTAGTCWHGRERRRRNETSASRFCRLLIKPFDCFHGVIRFLPIPYQTRKGARLSTPSPRPPAVATRARQPSPYESFTAVAHLCPFRLSMSDVSSVWKALSPKSLWWTGQVWDWRERGFCHVRRAKAGAAEGCEGWRHQAANGEIYYGRTQATPFGGNTSGIYWESQVVNVKSAMQCHI